MPPYKMLKTIGNAGLIISIPVGIILLFFLLQNVSRLTPEETQLNPAVSPQSLMPVQPYSPPQKISGINATVETDPIPHSGDAADDTAIWIHPTDTALSLIIGTDKEGGIATYSLDGKQLQYLAEDGSMNNVDIRYNFSFNGKTIDLIIASNTSINGVSAYTIEPASRQLINLGANKSLGFTVYGLCMYRSPLTGSHYFFITERETGLVQQWRIFDNGSGGVDFTLARSFDAGTQVEGCVADDVYGVAYFAEESAGIWMYGAEPEDDTNSRTLIDPTGGARPLTPDIEGLALYYTQQGGGYLIASSQGNSTYAIYDRQTKSYVGVFTIDADATVDAVYETDGIDIVNIPLGEAFPQGIFVAQDGRNEEIDANNEIFFAYQNFKLVPWERIANAFSPPLIIDTTWDARAKPRR